ncbi:MAG: hypothetical protein S4CHLAM2_05550 [Chlamydiales bacterium]|nr:hypothetical protein [Chlamydiales bacterium]
MSSIAVTDSGGRHVGNLVSPDITRLKGTPAYHDVRSQTTPRACLLTGCAVLAYITAIAAIPLAAGVANACQCTDQQDQTIGCGVGGPNYDCHTPCLVSQDNTFFSLIPVIATYVACIFAIGIAVSCPRDEVHLDDTHGYTYRVYWGRSKTIAMSVCLVVPPVLLTGITYAVLSTREHGSNMIPC